jgi:type IX secretion system PorP/SprF family membrane protein
MLPSQTNIKNMLKFKRLIQIIALFLLNISVQAQDIHFSQFYTTPLLTNPGNTGMSDEDLRIALNYRSQWAKIGNPFKSFYSSLDKKLSISNESFGIGGYIIHDQSSAYNLTADEIIFSLSYSKIIHNQQFSIGIQPGYVYKYYDATGLTFGSQFDATSELFNSNLPSMESGIADNLHYFDLNVGLFWRTLIRGIMPSAGIAIRHVTMPVETFSTSSLETRLPMKLTLNGQVSIPITSKFDIAPSFLYGYTTGTSELLVGGIEGYTIHNFEVPVKKLYAITMFRSNPMSNIDAMILGGGVKFTKFDLGITYDINVSPLSKATNYNGAFEISLIYTGGSHAPKNINEPCYIY